MIIIEGSDNDTKSKTMPSALGKNFSSKSVTTPIADLIGKNVKKANHPDNNKALTSTPNPAMYLIPNLDLFSKLWICAMGQF